MKVVAILLAAGSGKRFGEKKQFIKLKGEPLFQYSLNTVNKIEEITDIVLVLPEEDIDRVKIFSFKNVMKVIGGKERQDSVYNALKAIENADIVVVHDTARPFATEKMFIDGIKNVKKGWDGSITAIKARDTIKEVEKGIVKKTLNREKLFIIQTPQTFVFEKLVYAHEKAKKENVYGTDDSFLMEREGFRITVNEGSFLNFKVTTKEDIILANCLIKDKKPF
ncbi:2-C-methyl-D-erythritol 4-phosphate cytidylyltransferase [Persephonella hydrogeniphila]|uniref:2-C-methyl-D-erythritol 4-phosphate cytidylyltransferase n=1 Tax=Persephonella hydrogeniphila TaxID=198703 RepID=A0A285NUN8_9AQUI|nr:2-C-methyl-D-erythritol 4-phosphate cytidylyltransferase [Persephonella hydrogeniphila]SNZ11596.1 2-C-methyl-D-erythritol 4-phosphate cytidylyltransferase [Persephonella hydrogeniphila]